MSARYITTTLPYVNADPHAGFALEFVQADALARYYRLMGDDVFFNTGTDEHGQKIAEKADAAGQSRQEYVDHYAAQFDKLKDALNLSYDKFIRTTDPAHEAAAQEMWRRCAANGDIDKKLYKGLYCVGDEMFLRESDLVNGRCPNHPNIEPQEIEEENYYFKLSNYEDYLLEYLQDESTIMPEWQRQWALEFVKGGLGDLSISRPKTRLDWGIPVPDDDEHVMYVWFDALTNYISTLGWPGDAEGNFKKYWEDGETLQLAGKDQVRFQSIIWQAMLKSAGVKATDHVFYHGFINSGGQKMSKSIGNVISPYEMVEKYGTDATRYMLLRHVHPFDDSDITWERMDEWYTANLVNGLGNLVARVMKMSEDNQVVTLFTETDAKHHMEQIAGDVAGYNFMNVLNTVWLKIARADEKITSEQPFKVVKDNPAVGKAIIQELVLEVHHIAQLLKPFMPDTAKEVENAVLANKKPENLFPRLEQ